MEMMSRMIPPSTETGMSVFCKKGMNRLRMLATSMLASRVAKIMMNVQMFRSAKLMSVPPYYSWLLCVAFASRMPLKACTYLTAQKREFPFTW